MACAGDPRIVPLVGQRRYRYRLRQSGRSSGQSRRPPRNAKSPERPGNPVDMNTVQNNQRVQSGRDPVRRPEILASQSRFRFEEHGQRNERAVMRNHAFAVGRWPKMQTKLSISFAGYSTGRSNVKFRLSGEAAIRALRRKRQECPGSGPSSLLAQCPHTSAVIGQAILR